MRILASATTVIGVFASSLAGCAHNKANQYAYAPPLAPPVYPQPQTATPMVAAAPVAAPGMVGAPVMAPGMVAAPAMGQPVAGQPAAVIGTVAVFEAVGQHEIDGFVLR